MPRLRTLLAIMALFGGVMMTSSANAEKRVFSTTPRVIYARTAVGQIFSIDLVNRTAMISGYRYYFGNPVQGDASKISLYGYDAGSLEMLRVGMKVYIRYAELGTSRYVVSLKELAPSTDIHARGVKVDP